MNTTNVSLPIWDHEKHWKTTSIEFRWDAFCGGNAWAILIQLHRELQTISAAVW
jgi:hypothetical protein